MSGTIGVLVIGKNSHENNLDICLAARAFGASNVTFAGKKNANLVRYFGQLNKKWGGTFSVGFTNSWKSFIKEKRNYTVVYLTRFGLPVTKTQYQLRTYKNVMLVVTLTEGAQELYKISDFNVSITNQPHCSAAAVAVFLHQFFEGRELAMHFENAELKVVPEDRKIHIEKSR